MCLIHRTILSQGQLHPRPPVQHPGLHMVCFSGLRQSEKHTCHREDWGTVCGGNTYSMGWQASPAKVQRPLTQVLRGACAQSLDLSTPVSDAILISFCTLGSHPR